jgi:hypothetical protein
MPTSLLLPGVTLQAELQFLEWDEQAAVEEFPFCVRIISDPRTIAPRAGAWIETSRRAVSVACEARRPSRGGSGSV